MLAAIHSPALSKNPLLSGARRLANKRHPDCARTKYSLELSTFRFQRIKITGLFAGRVSSLE